MGTPRKERLEDGGVLERVDVLQVFACAVRSPVITCPAGRCCWSAPFLGALFSVWWDVIGSCGSSLLCPVRGKKRDPREKTG